MKEENEKRVRRVTEEKSGGEEGKQRAEQYCEQANIQTGKFTLSTRDIQAVL